MKNNNLFLGLFVILLLSIYSCNKNPCDEGSTPVYENGQTICLPDYVAGIEKSTEFGNRFYHTEHGIIKFENGKWTNQFGEDLTTSLNIKN